MADRRSQEYHDNAEFYKVGPGGIVVWRELVCSQDRGYNRRINLLKEEKPIITYQGEITQHSRRRLAKSINLLLEITDTQHIINPITKQRQTFKLAFQTLTLSSRQNLISDSDIKKHILQPYLRIMRRKGMKSYVWKAELQRNGNLHFHLLTNTFIEWSVIRNAWNNSQEKLGFISAFKKKHGHNNPNSTDVKAVRNDKAVLGYLLKYMLKPADKTPQQKLQNDINPARKGKVWDCSTNLKIKNAEYEFLGQQLYNHLEELTNTGQVRSIHKEFYKFYFIDKHQREKMIPASYLEHYKNYIAAVKTA